MNNKLPDFTLVFPGFTRPLDGLDLLLVLSFFGLLVFQVLDRSGISVDTNLPERVNGVSIFLFLVDVLLKRLTDSWIDFLTLNPGYLTIPSSFPHFIPPFTFPSPLKEFVLVEVKGLEYNRTTLFR